MMVSTRALILACVFSALGGGLVSGIVVGRFDDAPVEQEQPKKTKKAAPAKADSALEARLVEVERQLSSLRRSMQARQALTKYAESIQEESESADGKRPTKPTLKGVVDDADPVFELAVRSVMDRVEWEKDEERKAVRQQRRSERASRQTALLSERLQLSPEQAQEVAALLTTQMDSFRSLRNRDEGSTESRPATRSEWRERIQAIRKETESKLSEVLSDDQMKAYLSLAEEEGIGGRGFGRRGAAPGAAAPGASARGRADAGRR
jgi:hypothetical protein